MATSLLLRTTLRLFEILLERLDQTTVIQTLIAPRLQL